MARILLIDDEAAVRAGVARFLRSLGYDVLEADGGMEGLRIVKRSRVDLVITDINMPDVDGIEVILALGADFPGIPVIAMSGGGLMPKDILLSSAHLLGALTTLSKPFDLAELAEAVGAALARTPSGTGDPS